MHFIFRAALIFVYCLTVTAFAEGETELQNEIKRLQSELDELKARLTTAQCEAGAESPDPAEAIPTPAPRGLEIGGAIRVNYALGDYPGANGGGASRAWEDGGNVSLDTMRINLDYRSGVMSAKLEYRFYDGYHFLHSAWLGYALDGGGQILAGVNRVPFGPGDYGVSQSWFFDQHYYLGLADDQELGIKYSHARNDWNLDFAFYFRDEGQYVGGSRDSARYSYDVVNESGAGYEERNQLNLRLIRHFEQGGLKTDLGVSLQTGLLLSRGEQQDGRHHAGSIHMVNQWGGFTLASQATYFEHDIDESQPLGTDRLVQFGAYDFPVTVAAKGWVPAISLSYKTSVPGVAWLDYVVPYLEYSAVLKAENDFNDSQLITLGAAWARNNWYIYTDMVFSDGNEFVGGDAPFGDRLGANEDDSWMTRFNINVGYYY